LRQGIFVACDLRNHGGDRRIQCELLVVDEVATHPPEIDSTKEIRNIEIENIAAPTMVRCIRNDRAIFLEAVRHNLSNWMSRFYIAQAKGQKVRQASLQELQHWLRCMNLPNAAALFRYLKGSVERLGFDLI